MTRSSFAVHQTLLETSEQAKPQRITDATTTRALHIYRTRMQERKEYRLTLAFCAGMLLTIAGLACYVVPTL